jgi:hypothetical protein
MTETTYWHMQMHPNDIEFAKDKVHSILEHHKIIGLGDWIEDKGQIKQFCDEVKVNDVVAIKNGGTLIALVQIVGGAYESHDDSEDLGWIEFRRPIRVLDWAIEEKLLPQPRGTLNICADGNALTTKIIKEWHECVMKSFQKRKINNFV